MRLALRRRVDITRPARDCAAGTASRRGPLLEFLNATIKEYEGCATVKVRRAGDRASNIATLVAADEHGIVVSYHGPDQSKRFAHPWAA